MLNSSSFQDEKLGTKVKIANDNVGVTFQDKKSVLQWTAFLLHYLPNTVKYIVFHWQEMKFVLNE